MDDHESAELEALRRVPFFEDLTPEDLTRIAKIGQRRRYEAGSAIVTKDEAGGGLFVILQGSAQVETGGKVHTLGPGPFSARWRSWPASHARQP